MRFKCIVCEREHDLDQVSLGAPAPLQWAFLSDEERSKSSLGTERCTIDRKEGRSYYIRACLEIPIKDTGLVFTWGVWCSVSERSFSEILAHWDSAERTQLAPCFGWLCTEIPGYTPTAFLMARVHQRPVGLRPLVELEPTEHPLAVEQRQGIDFQRLLPIVTELMHQDDATDAI